MSKTRRDYEHLKPGQCMEDCIHLRACRRVQKIGRSKHLIVPRYCDEDCTCYETDYYGGKDQEIAVTVHDAISYARDEAFRIRSGYDEYDVFLESVLERWGFYCVRCD